ncbi:YggS family pyridoxal phosphate-dependent enzyme [Desulfotalea psychrophila]|uniref:Pyridoxal phosphate homeostasis protein n=1 Tax=Desulfotalea psychrophila (strain LSv54 / DSM 12343) TaxID=177439 RepID=Q6AJH1_DESPS|nr:YggS family pyridoxal phosphate-dependent enzyme [Desulfotalea psychrophila]CAG37509.1 conserved hypothetical protein [Desulfotalea psychrophila LSv54]
MICQNIAQVKERIAQAAKKAGRAPEDIQLVAVSKRLPAETVLQAIACGQQQFGENYIQEVQEKKELIGDKARFHFIGNLQSNKAKMAATYCSMVETVDRLKIAKALNKHSLELDKTLDILVQVNIGQDQNKSGTDKAEAAELIRQINKLPALRIRGLMTIPPLHKEPEDSRPHFRNLRTLAEKLVSENILQCDGRVELSMGMSSDYHIAIEEGATIVRVGTAIFGTRVN